MRGRDESGVAAETIDDDPFRVGALTGHLEPVRPESLRLAVERWIFDHNPAEASPNEQTPEQVDALGCTLDDDDPRRVGDDATRSPDVVGEHLLELAHAPRVAVVQECGRRRPQDL